MDFTTFLVGIGITFATTSLEHRTKVDNQIMGATAPEMSAERLNDMSNVKLGTFWCEHELYPPSLDERPVNWD